MVNGYGYRPEWFSGPSLNEDETVLLVHDPVPDGISLPRSRQLPPRLVPAWLRRGRPDWSDCMGQSLPRLRRSPSTEGRPENRRLPFFHVKSFLFRSPTMITRSLATFKPPSESRLSRLDPVVSMLRWILSSPSVWYFPFASECSRPRANILGKSAKLGTPFSIIAYSLACGQKALCPPPNSAP